MRITSERVLDVKEEMCLCFIDWQRACDRVDWTKLQEMLRNIEVNWREQTHLQFISRQTKKLLFYQGEIDSLKTGRKLGRDVACHSHYLTYN